MSDNRIGRRRLLAALGGSGLAGGIAAFGTSGAGSTAGGRRRPPPAVAWSRAVPNSDGGVRGATRGLDGGYVFVDRADSGEDGTVRGARIVRTDEFGRPVWRNVLGGAQDIANAVTRLGNGTYAFAGVTFPEADSPTAWVVTVDQAGEPGWASTYDAERARSILGLGDGGVLVGGLRSDGAWAARNDSSGRIVWQRDYNAIQVLDALDMGDSYVLAGETYDFGNKAWFARVRGDGSKLFDQSYGESKAAAHAIQPAGDGFVIAGVRAAPGEGETGRRAWVARLASDGAVENQRTLGEGDTRAYDLLDLGTAGYLLVGETVVDGDQGAWAAKVDGSLTVDWSSAFGGGGSQRARTAVAAASDEFLLGGRDGLDGWLLKLGGESPPTTTTTPTTTTPTTTTPTTTTPPDTTTPDTTTAPPTTRPPAGTTATTTAAGGDGDENDESGGGGGGGGGGGLPLELIGLGAGGAVAIGAAGAALWYVLRGREESEARVRRPSEAGESAEAAGDDSPDLGDAGREGDAGGPGSGEPHERGPDDAADAGGDPVEGGDQGGGDGEGADTGGPGGDDGFADGGSDGRDGGGGAESDGGGGGDSRDRP